MIRRGTGLVIAVGVAVVGFAMSVQAQTPAAQARPDFSGRWTARAEPDQGPSIMAVAQSPSGIMITVDEASPAGPRQFTIKLDGSESRYTMVRGGVPVEQVSRANWDGSKLVISTARSNADGPYTERSVWSLDGNNLVIVATKVSPTGANVGSTNTYSYSK
jgi:hypothetical protein